MREATRPIQPFGRAVRSALGLQGNEFEFCDKGCTIVLPGQAQKIDDLNQLPGTVPKSVPSPLFPEQPKAG